MLVTEDKNGPIMVSAYWSNVVSDNNGVSCAANQSSLHKSILGCNHKPNPEIASYDTESSETPNSVTRKERNNVSDGVLEENRQWKWWSGGRFVSSGTEKKKRLSEMKPKNKECIEKYFFPDT